LKAHLNVRGRGLRVTALLASALSTAAGLTGLAPAAAQTPTETAESATSLRVTSARKHVLAGQLVKVRGVIASGERGRAVYLQLRGRRGWTTIDRDRTVARGRFSVAWRPKGLGRYKLRVRMRAPSARSAGPAARRAVVRRTRAGVNVYRAGHASWYGPGFYGGRTACGWRLGAGTLGVAHKSLPCGTRVTFRYRGRSVTVPVIDRGPYVGGRQWDLTGATKSRLGFPSTGTVWATR
jgi:rare lipoprotein A